MEYSSGVSDREASMDDEVEKARARFKLVKPAPVGKEREILVARLNAIMESGGDIARAEGLTEEQMQGLLDDDE